MQAAQVIDITTLTQTHPLMKRNRAFNQNKAFVQADIKKMGIELKIDGRIKRRKQI